MSLPARSTLIGLDKFQSGLSSYLILKLVNILLHLALGNLLRLVSRVECPHAGQHKLLELELIVHFNPVVKEKLGQVVEGQRKFEFRALFELENVVLRF